MKEDEGQRMERVIMEKDIGIQEKKKLIMIISWGRFGYVMGMKKVIMWMKS